MAASSGIDGCHVSKCGIDVNRPNSYDQTALDIVNKFTTSRAAKELKQLLKESSYVVLARAIKDYHSVYDPRALSFRDGDYIKVVEQRADGVWKGQLLTESGHPMGKAGYFPSSTVVLVDRQALVNGPLCGSMNSQRRLMTPQVPDLLNRSSNYSQQQYNSHGHHHLQLQQPAKLSAHELALYNSVGADEAFPPPPSPLVTPKSPSKENDSDRDSGISPQQHYPPQGFPGQGYYHQQPSPTSPDPSDWYQRHVGDGDGRSGSPRDSPSSSNRNSSASTGSGGYLPSHNYVNLQITSQHRLSGQSYESGVSSSRQSYHSNSSSSLGSLDRLEESGYSSTVNVHELFQAGYSDSEVLRAWLADLHFEEYYNMFIQAAYDMPTISRMTPEDLTAIGITKPTHRKRLKAEISKLNIHDGIPDFKPANCRDWLRLLNLEFYYEILVSQGYNTIDNVTEITWEDLEDIGINKLGHQKKIMLAVERLKRIENVSRRLSTLERKSSVEMLEPPSSYPTPQWLEHATHYDSQENFAAKRSPSGDNLAEVRTFHREDSPGAAAGRSIYQPDVVAIQVNRGTPTKSNALHVNTSFSSGSSGEGSPRTYQSFQGPFTAEQERSLGALDLQGHDLPPHRTSLDDLDGSATLRRPSAMVSPRIAPKPKPVAKIIAKTKRVSREVSSTDIIKVDTSSDIEFNPGYSGTLGRKSTFRNAEPIYDSPGELRQPHSPKHVCTSTPPSSPQHSPNSIYGVSQVKGKKAPPPPPKRTNSMRSDTHPTHGDLQRSNSSPGPPVPSPKPPHLQQQHHQQQLSSSTPSSPGPHHPPTSTASPQHQPKLQPKPQLPTQQQQSQTPQQPPPQQQQKQQPQQQPPQQQQQNQQVYPGGVKALAEQFQRQGSDTSSESLPAPPQDYSPCDEEEFPPPPPPIYTDNDKSSAKLDHRGSAEVKRNASTTSIDSTTSVSSTESNTLPFANENVGTIKQRNPAAKPSIVSVSGEEDDKNVDLNASLFESECTDTIKRNPKASSANQLLDSPSHSAESKRVPPPTPKRRESIGASGVSGAACAAALDSPQPSFSGGKDSGDVLNDIGNMLQDLTDELDAMLEFELNS